METLDADCLVLILTDVMNDIHYRFKDHRLVCRQWFKLISEEVVMEYATVDAYTDGNIFRYRSAFTNITNMWVVQTEREYKRTKLINNHAKFIIGSSKFEEQKKLSGLPIKIITHEMAIQTVKDNNIKFVEFILHTSNDKIQSTFIKEAYIIAIENDQINMIKLFVSALKFFHLSPVPSALDKGDIEIIKLMLSQNSRTAEDEKFCIKYSIDTRGCSGLELLSKAGLKLDAASNFALKYAVEKGYILIVEFLRDQGIDISHEEALNIAILNDQFEMVKLLCPETRVFKSTVSLSDCIMSTRNRSISDFVIKHSGFVDGTSLLYRACSNGRTEIVKLLLSQKNIDLTDDNYRALNIAVVSEHYDIVKLLLEDERMIIPLALRKIIINLCSKL